MTLTPGTIMNLVRNFCRETILRRRYLKNVQLYSRCFSSDEFEATNANVLYAPAEFRGPQPEFDWNYLCDPNSRKEIEENIHGRKGVGDIHKVQELWQRWNSETEAEVKEKIMAELNAAAADIPNRTCQHSPVGDESKAEVVEMVGEQRNFDFKPKSVIDVGEKLGLLHTKNMAHTLGHRAYCFTGDLARLEHALIRFTLDRIGKLGFGLVSVPDIIHTGIVEACGFPVTGEKNQVYRLDGDLYGKLCLAGTSEMSLGGLFMNEVLEGKTLPRKVCAVSRCYRAESSKAAEEAGIYRVHQFTKVEMFVLTTPEQSGEMLQEIVGIEKNLFTELGLHFRILNMPTEELGAPAHQKYDIETWMPTAKFWGEISSASNCTDYQSRRLNIKYRNEGIDVVRHVHTLNGTACAIPRLIMAIVENNQNADGSVNLPTVLHSYMGGKTKLQENKLMKKMKFLSKPLPLGGTVS